MPGPILSTSTLTPATNITATTITDGYGGTTPVHADGTNPPVANVPWTSATAANTALTSSCEGYGIALVALDLVGTMSTGIVTFEGSPSTDPATTNWRAITGIRLDGNFGEKTFTIGNGSMTWHFNIAGMKQFRVRLSTAITGTGTAVFNIVIQAGTLNTMVLANLLTALDYTKDTITTYGRGGTGTNIASNTTSSQKSGIGSLVGVIVGDPGTAWQAAVYDNTAGSGTLIATLKFTASGFINCGPFEFSTGCTFVTSGTTAGNITPVIR